MEGKTNRYSIFVAMVLALSGTALAELPTDMEPGYAEAVLAYNAKDYGKAIKLLDNLLVKNPTVSEVLELKALALKSTSDDNGTANVYQKLIDSKLSAGKTPKEVAPYYFELGLIRFRENKLQEARKHLQESLRAEFNTAATHFFLGMVYFKGAQWASAEKSFGAVTKADVDALKPTAQFYLGQIALKTSYTSGATQHFYAARSQAQEQMSDPNLNEDVKKNAQQIYDTTKKVLEPFEHNEFFGNVSMVSGFDSNVLAVPSSQTSSQSDNTNKGTAKATLQVGAGYMTSPLRAVQFVPSYRGSFNFNTNRDTRTGEFIVHDCSVYMTRNALARTNYGLKLEGIYTFQDVGETKADGTTSTKFKPYSLTGSFGPYFRTEVARRVLLSVELFIQPQKNFLDSTTTADSARSGLEQLARVSVKNDTGSRFWNPGVALIADNNNTKGREFRSKALTLELNDTMHLTEVLQLNLLASYGFSRFGDRSDFARNDKLLVASAGGVYKLGRKYSLLGDFQYIKNASNVPSLYEYNRIVVSMGVAYTF